MDARHQEKARTSVNNTEEAYWDMPPIPWDPEDVWLGACPAVTKYLMDAFETAFGERPVEVVYSRFPDGHWARLEIKGVLEIDHNVWGILMAKKLRRFGLDLEVVVHSPRRAPYPDLTGQVYYAPSP